MTSTYSYTNPEDFFNINTAPTLNTPAPNNINYDYILTFNGQFGDYLNTKTWQNDNNSYIVDININLDYFSFGYNDISILSDNNDVLSRGFSGFQVDPNPDFDTRVLEILAIKIFGSALSTDAIENTASIVAPIKDNLSDHFQYIINLHKNDIFNQYVNTKSIDLNTNLVTNFDFTNDALSFPAFITGTLVSQVISNGPNVGGNLMINGSYNVPMLIQFGYSI